MWSFTFGHPEERYCSRDDWVLYGTECARFGVVRRGGSCDGSCVVVAACLCVGLVAGLYVLVVDEEVVIHTAVVGCLLCFLCVHLDTVLWLCLRSLVGSGYWTCLCMWSCSGGS